MPGCGKTYRGKTAANARHNLSKHVKNAHKLKLVDYRNKYETPGAAERRAARDARRASAVEPVVRDNLFDDDFGTRDNYEPVFCKYILYYYYFF